MTTPANAVPVRIRGEDFPTIAAAAAHYGVTSQAVCNALRRGTLERLGLTRPRDREETR